MTSRSLLATAAVAVFVCAPALAQFAGMWESNRGRMQLQEDGTHVQGDYDRPAGHIDGDVNQRTLEGIWVQQDSDHRCREKKMDSRYWGHFRLNLDENGKVFHGFWAHCDDALGTGGEWRGYRAGE